MPSSASERQPKIPTASTASLYDVDDQSESDYSIVRNAHAVDGAKLLFARSKVYTHPSPSAKDNVCGYLSLLERDSSETHKGITPIKPSKLSGDLVLAWQSDAAIGDASTVYSKQDHAESEDPPNSPVSIPAPLLSDTSVTATLGSAFALRVDDIYSLIIRPPSAGWWFGSVIINTRAGNALPPLFFHDSECQSLIDRRKRILREKMDPFNNKGGLYWGGDQLLKWLRHFVVVEVSPEPTVYLVNPSEEDKKGYGRPTPDKVAKTLQGNSSQNTAGKFKSGEATPVDSLSKAFKEARWSFLEKLSQVTTLTRRTAQAMADHENVPVQVRRLMQNPQVQNVQDDFDSARIYLARWAMSIAEQGDKDRGHVISNAKLSGIETGELGGFEILDAELHSLSISDNRAPVSKTEWEGFFDSRGRLQVTQDEVKDRIFHGGLSPDGDLRKEAWPFLLGVYEWNSTRDERRAQQNSLNDEYIRLKGDWWDRMINKDGSLQDREWWAEQKMRIEKDVHRTDRHLPLFAGEDIPHPDPESPFASIGTNVHLEQMKDMLLTYNEYNRDLGYVQGMSDLLAPIYVVMQDDASSFWAFTRFMDRMERNFLRDQSGMRLQLQTLDQLVRLSDPELYQHLVKLDSTNFFFFFRMLLVWYKREFEFADILCLWERLWTDYLSSGFHIFIALAILDKHRTVIIDHLKGFDEVLKYINELSNTIDLESTLVRAEILFQRFRRTVAAIDRKKSFPAPSTLQSARPNNDKATATSSKAQASNNARNTFDSSNDAASQPSITPELRSLLSRDIFKVDKEGASSVTDS